jgi:hypothetical protein
MPDNASRRIVLLKGEDMLTIQCQINKTVDQMRQSLYHQQLGRNVCAAFIAQQQGTKLDTAYRKIEDPIGDLWLVMAEIIRQQCFQEAGHSGPSLFLQTAPVKTVQ